MPTQLLIIFQWRLSSVIRTGKSRLKRKIDMNEISIKRVVSPENKSEHRLNDRVITKHELENILNCCGISMNNPYNIIQQGRIHKIAQMSEKDLYNILQEIIGTSQYETKKNESLKIFDQITKEKEKVQSMLEEISKYIDELNNEKELYKDYESSETEAICIEFCIYQKHLQELQRKLDSFSAHHADVMDKFTNFKNDEIELINYKDRLKNDMQTLQFREQTLRTNEAALADDRRDLQLKREKLAIQLNNMEASKTSSTQISTFTFDEPEKAQERVEELEDKLKSVSQEHQTKEHDLNQIKGQLQEYTKQLDSIYVNKGGPGFNTVQNKKKYYSDLIKQTEEKINKCKSQIAECQQIIDKNQETITANKNTLKHIVEGIKASEVELNNANRSISDAVQRKTEIATQVKGLIYKINQEKSNQDELKKNTGKFQRTLQQAMRDNLLYTIEGIMDLVRLRGIKGVYGLLIDLVIIPDKLFICCDIVLKNKLFGFVVDSYETADTLININKEIKGSTINIYPISWISDLKAKATEYPGGNDVIIVKNHVKPKDGLPIDVLPLIEHIFGKVLLVRDYNTATMMAKRYRLNCVTSEGELVYAGSYLTKLGFYDIREESLSVYLQYKEVKDKLDEVKVTIGKAEMEKDNLSNEDLQTTQSLQKLYTKRTELTHRLVAHKAELKNLVNANLVLEKINSENEGYIKLYEEEIKGLTNKIEIYEKERNNPALEGERKLKEEEKKTADELTSKIDTLKERVRKGQLELAEIQQTYKETHEELEKLRASLQGPQSKMDTSYEADIIKKEMELIDTQLFDSTDALEKVKRERKDVLAEISEKENEMKTTEDRKKGITDSKVKLEEELMKLNLEKGAFVEAKEVYTRKINQMDHVKPDMISQFTNKTIKELLSRLEYLRREKKKFTAKDKVLFERLDALNNKFEQFSEKLKDLEKNEEDAQNLVQTFDQNIQEKISKIFKSFTNHLQKYFSKITNGGKITAKLLKERRRDGDSQKYVAISLSASFSGGDEEEDKENQPENIIRMAPAEKTLTSMTSLSAGQKTVVATAFIFALQRCDPAPFYFLDEFDAALDQNFRKNIAQIISENSSYSQYFITTFKTELLGVPDASFFEVKFDGMGSRIAKISLERAQEILNQADPADERREESEM